MPPNNRFGSTIPDPELTLPSILRSVRAIKDLLEGTAGQRGVEGGAPQTYIQLTPPTTPRIGDTWVRPSQRQVTNKPVATTYFNYYDGVITSVWDGGQWAVTSVNGEYWEMYPGPTDIPINNTALFIPVQTTPVWGGRDQIWFITWRAMCFDTTNAAVFEAIVIDPDTGITYDTQAFATAFPSVGEPLNGSFVLETGGREGLRLRMLARDQTTVNGFVMVNFTSYDTSYKSTFMRGIRIG